MSMKKARYRKPDLLVLLTIFVGCGVLATSIAQAAESHNVTPIQEQTAKASSPKQWLQSLWGLDLTKKFRNWKPEMAVDGNSGGLNLSRPFGTRGPALRFSMALPGAAKRGLSAGGDHGIGASNDSPDAYLFLEKRW